MLSKLISEGRASLRQTEGKDDPVFLSYDDARAWIDQKIKEQGKNQFLSSDEYKRVAPYIRDLHKKARGEWAAGRESDMRKRGLDYGDRVHLSLVSPFGFADVLEGEIVKRGGAPYVRLDEPFQGRREVRWHRGWLPFE
jgi:hypothetical protein